MHIFSTLLARIVGSSLHFSALFIIKSCTLEIPTAVCRFVIPFVSSKYLSYLDFHYNMALYLILDQTPTPSEYEQKYKGKNQLSHVLQMLKHFIFVFMPLISVFSCVEKGIQNNLNLQFIHLKKYYSW